MNNKIHLNLSEESRAKFEQFKLKQYNIAQRHHPKPHYSISTTTTSTPERESDIYITEEEIFETTLATLLEGMRSGNQLDKKAAEYLVQSIKYKFSKDFHEKCLILFEEALKEHEKFFNDNVFSSIVKATQNLAQHIGKITQQILMPDQESQEDTERT